MGIVTLLPWNFFITADDVSYDTFCHMYTFDWQCFSIGCISLGIQLMRQYTCWGCQGREHQCKQVLLLMLVCAQQCQALFSLL